MPSPLTLALLMTLGLGLLTSTAEADDARPASLVFNSSDLPDLAKGFSVPRPGEYTIKTWGTGRFDWYLKSEGAQSRSKSNR